MTAVMQGVRVLEVAEHTFVPAASALLADWGAEVVKIEHVERGDAMRGLASSGTVSLGAGAHVLLEKLGEQIEVLDERMLTNRVREVTRTIHLLKREMIWLRKAVWPLREMVSTL